MIPSINAIPRRKPKPRLAHRRWEKSLGRFEFSLDRFINTQCLALGISINWNFRPSLEMDFLLWRGYVGYCLRPSNRH